MLNISLEQAQDFALKMILISLGISSVFLCILFLIYFRKYLKRKAEIDEAKTQRQIIKQAEKVVEKSNALLFLDALIAEKRKQAEDNGIEISDEELERVQSGNDQVPETSEAKPKVDYNTQPIKELHKLALARGIKGATRMKKDKLVKLLIQGDEAPGAQT